MRVFKAYNQCRRDLEREQNKLPPLQLQHLTSPSLVQIAGQEACPTAGSDRVVRAKGEKTKRRPVERLFGGVELQDRYAGPPLPGFWQFARCLPNEYGLPYSRENSNRQLTNG
jgi:hypothetical protein